MPSSGLHHSSLLNSHQSSSYHTNSSSWSSGAESLSHQNQAPPSEAMEIRSSEKIPDHILKEQRKRQLQCHVCLKCAPYRSTDVLGGNAMEEDSFIGGNKKNADEQQPLDAFMHQLNQSSATMVSSNKSPISAQSNGSVDPAIAMKTVERCIRRVRKLRYDLLQGGLLQQPTQKYTAHDLSHARIIAPLLEQEIHRGVLLGAGGFSSVYEVTDFTPVTVDGQLSNGPNPKPSSAALPLAQQLQLSPSHPFRNMTPLELQARVHVMEKVHRPADLTSDMDLPMQNAMKSVSVTTYSIKHLRKGLAKDPALFERAALDLALEAQLLLAMDHPHIVAMRGWSHHGVRGLLSGKHTGFFILMDRLPETLEDRIFQWREDVGALRNRLKRVVLAPWRKQKYCTELDEILGHRLHVIQQIASGLEYMHKWRILNRDLKPANIGFGAKGVLKLFDFGLSRLMPLRKAGFQDCYRMSRVGTKYYMAPEVHEKQPYNTGADVYSFGVVAWEILALASPGELLSKTALGRQKPKNIKDSTASSSTFSPFQHLREQGHNRCPLPMCDCWPTLLQETLASCLLLQYDRRPSMTQILHVLQTTLKAMGYEHQPKPRCLPDAKQENFTRQVSFRVNLNDPEMMQAATTQIHQQVASSSSSPGPQSTGGQSLFGASRGADDLTTLDDHDIVLSSNVTHAARSQISTGGGPTEGPSVMSATTDDSLNNQTKGDWTKSTNASTLSESNVEAAGKQENDLSAMSSDPLPLPGGVASSAKIPPPSPPLDLTPMVLDDVVMEDAVITTTDRHRKDEFQSDQNREAKKMKIDEI